MKNIKSSTHGSRDLLNYCRQVGFVSSVIWTNESSLKSLEFTLLTILPVQF